MTQFESMLSDAVRAVTVGGDGSFYWFGERSAPETARGARTRRKSDDHLRFRLQRRLYWNFYATGKAIPILEEDEADDLDEESFVNQLSAANCGRGAAENGWHLISSDGAIATIARNGLTFRVAADRITKTRSAEVTLHGLNELRGISPGFYTALGDATLLPDEPVIRVYWNIRSAGAVSFIRNTTRIFNDASIAFRAKVVSNPLDFDRRDPAVLYVMRRDWRRVRDCLRKVHRALRSALDRGTPALTKEIGCGVGIAEDPPLNMSFGEHRCHLIADALVDAHKKRRTTHERRLEEVFANFEQNGVSPAAPFLNVGSGDIYESIES